MDVRLLGGPLDYVCALEEVVILTLNDFGLAAERIPDVIGVWVGDVKVASVGVRISRGISTHGFALNVNTDSPTSATLCPVECRARWSAAFRASWEPR